MFDVMQQNIGSVSDGVIILFVVVIDCLAQIPRISLPRQRLKCQRIALANRELLNNSTGDSGSPYEVCKAIFRRK